MQCWQGFLTPDFSGWPLMKCNEVSALRTVFRVLAGLWLLSDPALADPPQLTGPEGPPIVTQFGTIGSTLVSSERGLAISFDDLTDVAPVAVVNGVEGFVFDSYAPTSGLLDYATTFPIISIVDTAFGYTATTTTQTETVAVDGGVQVLTRLAATGAILATTLGATLDQAVEAALALPQVMAVSYVATQVVANGTSEAINTTTTRMITGRDTYVSAIVIAGPTGTPPHPNTAYFVQVPFSIPIRGLGRCTTAITDCEGGTEATIATYHTLFLGYGLQDLYITETVTDTVTTVQNYFLDLILAGGDGAPHAGAQAVGFEAAEGFLQRMEDEAAAGRRSAATLPTSGTAPQAGRFRAFAAYTGANGSFDQIGGIEDSDWDASGVTGGFVYALSPEWTVGATIEEGTWSWDGDGAQSSGDASKVGLFAAWSQGPWQVTVAGFAGQHEVETEDALGVTSDYEADLRGASVAVGYAIAAGDWTITPGAALRWVQWDTPRVTDSAGGVVEAAQVDQWRPEIGVSAWRSVASDRGTLDLGIDARVWTVEGDHVAVWSGGFLTEWPETGEVGGSLGLHANWQVAPGAAITGSVTGWLGDAPGTSASVGLRMVF